ncbi:MAG: type III pantothenate kinase [Gammaproteobacteria bacterium]|jgi:type III pantothenate kinase|nr:type III pantothenate kinase [Gammaproteobacteria bacterium]
MNLLLDIGNTRIKWALHDSSSASVGFVASGDVPHQLDVTEALGQVHSFIESSLANAITGIWVVNVAGETVRKVVEQFVLQRYSLSARFAQSEVSLPGLVNGYKDAAQLGADRWAAMIGAVSLISEPVCVVDAGTAVTIDFISQGKHLGGLILPGLGLMQSALFSATGDIELFTHSLDEKRDLCELGIDTDTAVRNGAAQAIVGAIQFALSQKREQFGEFKLLLTGGDGSALIPLLGCCAEDYRVNLVLQGLAEIADAN